MNVAIVGYGFVGKAVENAIKDVKDIFIIDPKLKNDINVLKDKKIDFIFLCLPTPMREDGGQDIKIILNVLEAIENLHLKSQIVLKSTVLPSNINIIQERNSEIIYNPEFLREKRANEDFINASLILFGGKKENCEKLSKFYTGNTRCLQTDHTFVDIISASIIKYSINSFLATKVIFFNELYQIFTNSGSKDSWEKIISSISKDLRIGNTHMNVPGHDGRRGFGGACFPKDINALYKYSKEINAEFNILKKAISLNNKLRDEYNDLLDREKEQNINFKLKE